ncbi:MAG TPA: hypothetical protein VHE55_01945 [Fimbriimonadaceae bacterium]|nr:hypothetical protein [Fimbriimonadaceae bacterium]
MVTLLACVVALAPSPQPVRVMIVPQSGRVDSKQMLEFARQGKADARRLMESWRPGEQAQQSPYAVRPSRNFWPYSQLPANPQPSDIRTDKGRYWLIERQ